MENEKIASEILEFEKKSYLCSPEPFLGELSSAGSERLPYKQRVGGSNPSAPTTSAKTTYGNVSRFFVRIFQVSSPASPESKKRDSRCKSHVICLL